MKNRNVVLLALAIGCGLVAAFLTAKLGASGKSTEMVPVLVAAKNLDQGTKIDEPEKMFVRKPFPKESVPPEFIDDPAQMKGKVLARSIRAGTHCTLADLGGNTSIALPVGADGTMYKGVAIRVSQSTAVSGFIQPGDRVDVMVVERQQNGKTTSTLLLQNVLVVAINEINVKPEGTGAVKNASTITLAVKGKEGLILNLAQNKGELNLMLRSKDDMTVANKTSRVVEGYGDLKDEGPTAGATTGTPAATETVKVPVAKKDLPTGTKIEDPNDLFEEKELPETALAENTIRDMSELKGQTITKFAFAGMPVAKAAIEGELPKPPVSDKAAPNAVIAEGPRGHTMIIQIGTQAPQYVKYDDKGRLLENGKVIEGSAPAKADKIEKPADSPAIKPEEKSTKDD